MTPTSTLTSLVTYQGDGTTRDFTFSFPYLDPDHAVVTVDGDPVAFTLIAPQVVRTNVPPAASTAVQIARVTPSEPYVSIPDGGIITPELLQSNEDQARYIAEEARDLSEPALRFNPALNAYDAKGFRIARGASATDPTDLIIKSDVDVSIATALGGDALGNVVAQATADATQIHNDRLDVDAKAATMTSQAATAAALATAVADGPDGATIIQRITDFLGTDAWLAGTGAGGGTVPSAGTHKYWRWHLKDIQDSYTTDGSTPGIFITGIEFRPTPGTAYPATGGTAFSKDTDNHAWTNENVPFDGYTGGFGAYMYATTAHIQSNGAWIGYQFASPLAVRELAIKPQGLNLYPYQFAVQYSDDGATYSDAVIVTNPRFTSTSSFLLIAIPAVGAHAYWRIKLLQTQRRVGPVQLRELQFRKTAGVAETMADLGTGSVVGTAWSTSTALFDGDASGTSTVASVYVNDSYNNMEDVYIVMSFTTARSVAEFAITVDGAYNVLSAPSAFDIEWSDDGSAWTLAASFTGQSSWGANETRLFAMPSTIAPGAENIFDITTSGNFTRPSQGRLCLIECWGAGGANNGGGGGYKQRFVRRLDLPITTTVTIGQGAANQAGGNTSFGSFLTAYGGTKGGALKGGDGGNQGGPLIPDTGEGHGGNATTPPTDGFEAGGGGTTSGTAGSSVYGGKGGGPTPGTSVWADGFAGGGGPATQGQNGHVRITVW